MLSRVTNDTGQLQTAIITISNDLIRQPVTFLGALSALVCMALPLALRMALFCFVLSSHPDLRLSHPPGQEILMKKKPWACKSGREA